MGNQEGYRMERVGTRRVPAVSQPARAKMHQYVNNILAEMEAEAKDPDALPLMQDTKGNLAEGSSYNFFLVKDGEIRTPQEQGALAGVPRGAIVQLAKELNIPFVERD